MIKIKERKNGNEVYYEITCEKSQKTVISRIHYRAVVREIDDRDYFVLYDSNMVPVHEVFEFLNYTNIHQSVNSRTKSLQALKLLYPFVEIIGKAFSEFSFADINNLRLFLKGVSPSGAEISIELLTQRSNCTVNGYLRCSGVFSIHWGSKTRRL